MTTETTSPLEVIQAFNSAMERMDYNKALQHVADDIEYINGPNAPVRGPQGIRNELEPFFTPIEENEFVILRQAIHGNVVFMERLDRHRIPQGWFELPVTGVYEVRKGKIAYWRDYFNLATVMDGMTSLMRGAV